MNKYLNCNPKIGTGKGDVIFRGQTPATRGALDCGLELSRKGPSLRSSMDSQSQHEKSRIKLWSHNFAIRAEKTSPVHGGPPGGVGICQPTLRGEIFQAWAIARSIGLIILQFMRTTKSTTWDFFPWARWAQDRDLGTFPKQGLWGVVCVCAWVVVVWVLVQPTPRWTSAGPQQQTCEVDPRISFCYHDEIVHGKNKCLVELRIEAAKRLVRLSRRPAESRFWSLRRLDAMPAPSPLIIPTWELRQLFLRCMRTNKVGNTLLN